MRVLDLESGKGQLLHEALSVDLKADAELKGLAQAKEELKARVAGLKDLLSIFTRSSSMRIENVGRGYRFVFWNIKQSQPGKEFWVEVLVSEGKMKMGEVSDYFYGRENLITCLESHHDLLSFLKAIRDKFKAI